MVGIDILGLGAVAVDDLLYVEHYPPADAKVRVQRRERRCGGLASAALIGAARLGAQCSYAGVLGEDELSEFAMESLRREQIDVRSLKRLSSARCIHSVVIVDQESQTRNIFYDTDGFVGAALDWPPPSLIESAAVLLIDHVRVEGMRRAAEIARNAGCPVVGDLESDRDPEFRALLGLVDHLIIPASFGQKVTGQSEATRAVAQFLREQPGRVVVLTQGKAGCVYGDSPESVRHQPACLVQTTNTTGCGDVFHGAYAFGLARGLSLDERIRLASAAAAVHASRAEGESGAGFKAQVQGLLGDDDKVRKVTDLLKNA